jgi:SAM-dependent methyltransferase
MTSPARQMWEDRFGHSNYLFGTEPNDFLREAASDLPLGDVLCLAEGEGRNAVFLAGLGHRVSAVDLTQAGVDKTRRLAEERGVTVDAVTGDLADFELGEGRWDTIVSIFAHTPPTIRVRVHSLIHSALRPGGRLILESYTPDQIGRGTGGPSVPELTMTLAGLRTELEGLTILHGAELERAVIEGPGHTGMASVVQVIAIRP